MVSNIIAYRKICRLCGSEEMESVLELTPTPLGDVFISRNDINKVQEVFPLNFLLCKICGNVQLDYVVDPETIYREYTYLSSVSLELAEHFDNYADKIIEQSGLVGGSLIVEIGSNEGALLNFFKKKGMRVLGIDPALEIAKRATESGIETIADYFSLDLAKKIKNKYGPVSVIIANNVIANVDNFSDFIDGIRELLASERIFVFETSYLLDVIQKNLIDTIFHEHLSYLSVKPVQAFLKKAGLELISVELVPTKGGSFRGIAQLIGGPRKVQDSVNRQISREGQAQIHQAETFNDFTVRMASLRTNLKRLIDDIKSDHKTIAAYGAAVGLTTMIYHLGIGKDIDFIIDDNPVKQNTLSPGYHIPVFSPRVIYDRKPDYLIILAWRYAKSIIGNHRRFLKQGGHFINLLPNIEVIKK